VSVWAGLCGGGLVLVPPCLVALHAGMAGADASSVGGAIIQRASTSSDFSHTLAGVATLALFR
jgi:hypothetical protein